MANPLDRRNGPVANQGRRVRVIDSEIAVTVGVESVIFEVIVCICGFIPATLISFVAKPDWEPVGYIIAWCCGVLPALIYWFMKINAKNRLQTLNQEIQAKASTVENYMKNRLEVMKNLASLVQKATNLDTDVMQNVAKYRSGNFTENEKIIRNGFNALMPHIEAYPELKSHAAIQDAMRQNNYLQREITAARDLYNQKVLDWNSVIFDWPLYQIVAARQGYTTIVPYTISDEEITASESNFFA